MGVGVLGALAVAQIGVGVAGAVQENKKAKKDAEVLGERGRIEAALAFQQGQRVLSSQTAAFGASGVTQEGSPQDVANTTISLIHQEAIRRSSPFFEESAKIESERRGQMIAAILGSVSSGIGTIAGNSKGSSLGQGGSLLDGAAPAATHGVGTRVGTGGTIMIASNRRGGR